MKERWINLAILLVALATLREARRRLDSSVEIATLAAEDRDEAQELLLRARAIAKEFDPA